MSWDGWRDAGRLLGVSVLVLAVFAACDAATERLLEATSGWHASLDPRARIFWDHIPGDARIVLLGDSVFASYYVDRPGQRLGRRLASRSGRPVFAACLNGARAEDMLSLARLVASAWPARTVVFIGLHPARVFDSATTTLDPTKAYEREFTTLVDEPTPGESAVSHINSRILVELARRSFLLRNQEWIDRFFTFELTRQPDWSGDQRSLSWRERGDFAIRRLQELGSGVARKDPQVLVPFAWAEDLHGILAQSGLRPVFVLTPLNRELLRERAGDGGGLEARLVASHQFLLDRLRAKGYEYADLFDGLEDSAFADAIHTNATGDDWMSERLASRVRGEDRPN